VDAGIVDGMLYSMIAAEIIILWLLCETEACQTLSYPFSYCTVSSHNQSL